MAHNKMKEQEIIQHCIRLGTLKPLYQALRFNAIKFKPLSRTIATFFAMRSVGKTIFFEHDIYFYTKINGEDLDKMIFVNDDKNMKIKVENELRRINDSLRGIF